MSCKKKLLLLLLKIYLLPVLVSFDAYGAPQRFHFKDLSQRNVLSFSIDSPLEKVIAQNSLVRGWIELDLDKLETGIKGEIEFDMRSFQTGSGIRDLVWQEKILETKQYPEAVLKVLEWGQTIKGALTKEKTNDFLVKTELIYREKNLAFLLPIKLAYFTESEKTRSKLPGNLLRLSSRMDWYLSQLGITVPQDLKSVIGERMEVVLDLVGTDKLPNEKILLPEGPKPKERS